MERIGGMFAFLIRNLLVGGVAGACLGLLVCIASIPTVVAIGFPTGTVVSTTVVLAAITAAVGAILGAVLLPVFALILPGMSSSKIARHAVIGGLAGVIVCAYLVGFFRPSWATDATFVGAILGSATAVARLRRQTSVPRMSEAK
jgi:hypothetical protein